VRTSHLFDTSALLTHYFDEPGAAIVQDIWETYPNSIGISVLTIPEFRRRLWIEIEDTAEIDYACHRYFNLLTRSVPIDRAVAELVEHIRVSTEKRIPLIDALIATCARSAGAVLVHKDPHMAVIPEGVVSQICLAK
jgi:predicted nucleic acid-binding protein